ncbi:MAG: signal peptidase I [Candidatus Omnitrophota bacterium]
MLVIDDKDTAHCEEIFREVFSDLLKSGVNVRLKALGWSMHPTIKNGEYVIIKAIDYKDTKIGDIIACQNISNKKMIIHRLVKKINHNESFVLFTKGDNNLGRTTDSPIESKDYILGKVIRIENDGKIIDLEDGLGRFNNYLISLFSLYAPWFLIIRRYLIRAIEAPEIIPIKLYNLFKRSADIVISLLILFLMLPLILLLILLIKMDSPGSSIFRQKRVGRDGREFTLYKFRTMEASSPIYETKPKDDDPRITRTGRFLRKTGLDELPQIFNVLKGDMSLVGPRPEMPFIVKNYAEVHKQRLLVKPGITGLWQISGQTKQPILANLEYDLYYINNQSVALDFKILLRTFGLLINNAYYLFK